LLPVFEKGSAGLNQIRRSSKTSMQAYSLNVARSIKTAKHPDFATFLQATIDFEAVLILFESLIKAESIPMLAARVT